MKYENNLICFWVVGVLPQKGCLVFWVLLHTILCQFIINFLFNYFLLTHLVSRQELSRQGRTAGLEHLLEVLVQEGHIYTTCDQDHFMATDA